MVDVAAKADTHRIAVASGRIVMQAGTLALVQAGTARKGDVLASRAWPESWPRSGPAT